MFRRARSRADTLGVDGEMWSQSIRGRHREGWMLTVLALALILALGVAMLALASGLRIDPARLAR